MVRAVRIPQQHAEAARKELRRLDALSHEYLPSAVHDAILLPLKPSAQLDNTWEVVEAELQCRPQKRSQKLRDHLEHALSEEQVLLVRKAVDIVGDIATLETGLEINDEVQRHIGHCMLQTYPRAKAVYRKLGGHEGALRLQKYAHLAGEDRTVTVASEAGTKLKLDIAKVYYSPRSAPERLRIAGLVKSGERVLVMFCGIGPYVCVLGRATQAREIIGVELNEDAYRYCVENINGNGLERRCFAVPGDVVAIVPTLGQFDRVIVPMPHTAEYFLSTSIPAAKPAAMVHIYFFDSEEAVNLFADGLPSRIQTSCGRSSFVEHIQRCGQICQAFSSRERSGLSLFDFRRNSFKLMFSLQMRQSWSWKASLVSGSTAAGLAPMQ